MTKRKESLLVRDNIVKIVEEKLKIFLSFTWNDLYKINGGEVRRLKGLVWDLNGENKRIKKNDDIERINRFISDLGIEGYEIRFRKLDLMEESSYVILTIEWKN